MNPLLLRLAAPIALALAVAGCTITHTSQAPSQLVAVGPPEIRSNLDGTLWLWQTVVASDGTGFAPPLPYRYTLRFLDGGQLEVRADCNRGTGRWIAHPDGMIVIGSFSLSKLDCGRGSLDRVFVDNLLRVNRFTVGLPDLLWLTLPKDAGTMTFQALGPERLSAR
jgi:hypothetical protein